MKPSQANADALLFREDIMAQLPSLEEWYNNPNGTQSRHFSSLTVSAFRKWQESALERLRSKGKQSEVHRKAELSGKGKRYVEIDPDMDEGLVRPVKKGKTHRYTSADLDGDDE
jgi:hypothetical protein